MTLQKSQNGFTLVEVLVALVITALLTAIIMDGAVSAKDRSQNQRLQMEALIAARSHVDDLRDQPGEPTRISGESGKIYWALVEREISRDPRGTLVLVAADISVGPADNPSLVILQKRYVKKLLVQ